MAYKTITEAVEAAKKSVEVMMGKTLYVISAETAEGHFKGEYTLCTPFACDPESVIAVVKSQIVVEYGSAAP
jgi:hypothetical protein